MKKLLLAALMSMVSVTVFAQNKYGISRVMTTDPKTWVAASDYECVRMLQSFEYTTLSTGYADKYIVLTLQKPDSSLEMIGIGYPADFSPGVGRIEISKVRAIMDGSGLQNLLNSKKCRNAYGESVRSDSTLD